MFFGTLVAASNTEAQHTPWWGWVLCGIVAVASTVAGWFVFARSRTTADQRTVWFRLVSVHNRLWGGASSRTIAAERLAGGLGLSVDDATFSTTTIPTTATGHGWLGDSHARLVGVPEHAAARMSFAASGCGVWALPAEAPPPGAQRAGVTGQVKVPAAPGWFVGLTDGGEPMALHPIPGASFAVFGTAGQLRALEGSLGWPEELYELRRVRAEASGPVGADAVADRDGSKTLVTLVEIMPAAQAHPTSRRLGRGSGHGFAAAEEVLTVGRERMKTVGGASADVYIAIPPVGTGTVLVHGDHREYFNFFAVTPPAQKAVPTPASA